MVEKGVHTSSGIGCNVDTYNLQIPFRSLIDPEQLLILVPNRHPGSIDSVGEKNYCNGFIFAHVYMCDPLCKKQPYFRGE